MATLTLVALDKMSMAWTSEVLPAPEGEWSRTVRSTISKLSSARAS
jgi:hypothetical protein